MYINIIQCFQLFLSATLLWYSRPLVSCRRPSHLQKINSIFYFIVGWMRANFVEPIRIIKRLL